MYESPLDIALTPINTIAKEIRDEIDGRVMKEIITATHGVNINVNKDELIKALNYDRNQYQKGYADAKASIIHCKDCKYWKRSSCCEGYCGEIDMEGFDEDHYCGFAERREE